MFLHVCRFGILTLPDWFSFLDLSLLLPGGVRRKLPIFRAHRENASLAGDSGDFGGWLCTAAVDKFDPKCYYFNSHFTIKTLAAISTDYEVLSWKRRNLCQFAA